jgi:hypothetical protein
MEEKLKTLNDLWKETITMARPYSSNEVHLLKKECFDKMRTETIKWIKMFQQCIAKSCRKCTFFDGNNCTHQIGIFIFREEAYDNNMRREIVFSQIDLLKTIFNITETDLK